MHIITYTARFCHQPPLIIICAVLHRRLLTAGWIRPCPCEYSILAAADDASYMVCEARILANARIQIKTNNFITAA